jgi:hypothetical protein
MRGIIEGLDVVIVMVRMVLVVMLQHTTGYILHMYYIK